MYYSKISGQFGIVVGAMSQKASNLTVKRIVKDYWDGHIQHQKYAYNTKFILEAIIQKLGDSKIYRITKFDIEEYKRARLADKKRNGSIGNISPRTVQMELQLLNAAVNFAIDNKLLHFNPIKRLIHVRQNPPKQVVLDDGHENGPQWISVYNAVNDNVKPILLTLYETQA